MPEAVQALIMRAGIVVEVTPKDRRQLEAIVGDRNAPQKHVWRAKIILATADGCGTAEIMRRSGKAKPVVWRWQERSMREGLAGLTPRQDAQTRQAAAAGSDRTAGGRSGPWAATGRSNALDRPDVGAQRRELFEHGPVVQSSYEARWQHFQANVDLRGADFRPSTIDEPSGVSPSTMISSAPGVLDSILSSSPVVGTSSGGVIESLSPGS